MTWPDKLDITATGVTVRPMSSKWASCCAAGRLTFDESLLGRHEGLQDHVIDHELLHFRMPNHDRLWKSLTRVDLGDCEILENRLTASSTTARRKN